MTQLNMTSARRHLREFRFQDLFIEELGWDNARSHLTVQVDAVEYRLQAIAQKRGMVVFVHWATADIPPANTRNQIERLVAKTHREHFLVFVDGARTEQIWLWVRREIGQPLARRTVNYAPRRQSGDLLLQKLQTIAFSFAEEEDLTLVDVTSRVRAAFNVERATKKFYENFKKERTVFEQFVQGIPDVDTSKWYVSVMLNRLMFVYFIQRKGFLDGDPDYLRNRLRQVQQQHGDDQFHSFYRYFLLRLFHEGLGQPHHDPELERLIGMVPYLNGGIFQIHEVEQSYPNIQISDAAFERIFDFFDQYQWHLDDRPLRDDREINPDVLGYIFEKYINQKQMGAYYTKEDITEYISKNTIIPFLFDQARQDCAIAFTADGPVWSLPQVDPDRYIYEAVRHGTEHPLPPDIAAGIDDVAQRGPWNTSTPDPFALPTETWRETVARRQRYEEVRGKLAAGEVTVINDFITLNLDIQQLAQDVIENSEGADLLSAFWKALTTVSVLDPTCGSGAFLFAALNILQPLYEAAIERMHAFMAEPEWVKLHPRYAERFGRVLADIDRHPNLTYFVLKSIVVNNLYGVDIMPEAVEIARLRLFLKLTAQVARVEDIEPLPDIDFNIRAGNTLVGFASKDEVAKALQVTQTGQGRLLFGEDQAALAAIEEKAGDIDRLFSQFRQMQTSGDQRDFDAADFGETKQRLQKRLRELDDELNRLLARQYGVQPDNKRAYKKWLDSHQPFHWFTEFFGILKQGGFDVIVGNPPYVSRTKVEREYTVRDYLTQKSSDIYAWVMERVANLTAYLGRTGMIVPLSLGFSKDFDQCRKMLFQKFSINWFSSFGRIPSALFSFDVRVRNTIHLGFNHGKAVTQQQFTTRLYRWFDSERAYLFPNLLYAEFTPEYWQDRIPKFSSQRIGRSIEALLKNRSPKLEKVLSPRKSLHPLYFKKTAYNWLNFCIEKPPCYDNSGRRIEHTQFDALYFDNPGLRDLAFQFLNGKILFIYWAIVGDDFHVAKWMFTEFPIDFSNLDALQSTALSKQAKILTSAMQNAVSFKLNAGKNVGNYNLAKCRYATDSSDAVFLELLRIPELWDEIELMYGQIVRTNFDDEVEES
ncbi:MAG: Eco57I restriction-modification methylase domain-containing protein [Ardenticatenaceae bacterium]|nr:Eco57I restriction-modification methylase domain-containing protein [Ardenticatenaceae bacterium]